MSPPRSPKTSAKNSQPAASPAKAGAARKSARVQPATKRIVAKPAGGEVVVLVDCGSTSVRASIVEVGSAGVRTLEDLRFAADLTGGLRDGLLPRAAMLTVEQALAEVQQVARGYGSTRMRVVGSAALREADNADLLIEHLRTRLGLNLEVLEPGEEARLYFEALRNLFQRADRRLRGNTILLDLGAGHTSTALISDGRLVHAVDEHYGTVRVLGLFEAHRDSPDFADAVDRLTLGAVRMLLGRLPAGKRDELIMTGGEVRQLCQLLHGDQPVADLAELRLAEVDDWFQRMRKLTPIARAKACAVELERAALLLPAASMLRHLGHETGIATVLVPQMTLRDGLIADLAPGATGPYHLDREHLLAAAAQMAGRFGVDLAYARNTASLARQIFDQTASLHGMDDRDRTLLEIAAMLHDVGSFLNVRNRHKHTLYILQNADMAGLTRHERAIIAHVARYHRRSAPKPSHIEFQALPREVRVRIMQLAAILRLAYALDVERSQRIRSVRCTLDDQRLVLRADRRQIALERWSLHSKSGLFTQVFGREVTLAAREED